MLDPQKKAEIIEKYRVNDKDTGSAEVQIAVLTERIKQLTRHMTDNGHDYHSKRSLLKLVGQRRHLLAYLEKTDVNRYKALIAKLGLRK
jgi:small subunit ribosomal protein S15